jgi:hypothetical protein
MKHITGQDTSIIVISVHVHDEMSTFLYYLLQLPLPANSDTLWTLDSGISIVMNSSVVACHQETCRHALGQEEMTKVYCDTAFL